MPICRYSNVILAEPDNTILLCAYQVGSKMSSARQLQTGGTYQVPPKPQGLAPDLAELLDSWQQTVSQAAQMVSDKPGKATTVADGMVRAYQVRHRQLSQKLTSWHVCYNVQVCIPERLVVRVLGP